MPLCAAEKICDTIVENVGEYIFIKEADKKRRPHSIFNMRRDLSQTATFSVTNIDRVGETKAPKKDRFEPDAPVMDWSKKNPKILTIQREKPQEVKQINK